MLRKKLYWYCTLLFVSAISVYASEINPQKQLYHVQPWAQQAGLPSNIINGIATSTDGFLWFATDNGIIRFDGMQVIIFNSVVYPEIDGSRFTFITQSHLGGIVAIAKQQFITIDRGQVHVFPFAFDNSVDITSLAVATNGSFVIGTAHSGIFIQDRAGSVSRLLTSDGLPSNEITSLNRDSSGKLWIGTKRGAGSFHDNKFERLSLLGENHITAITTSPKGDLWLGTKSMGVFHWADNILTQYTTGAGLSSNAISALAVDFDNNIWIGTKEHGLNKMSGLDVVRFNSADDLTDMHIEFVVSDISGTIWTGSKLLGISQIRRRTVQTLTTDHGLSSNLIQAMHQSADGSIWVGTFANGLMQIRGDRIVNFTSESGLPNNHIQALHSNRQGPVYIGTPSGLAYYHNRSLFFVDGTEQLSVRSILVDQKENVWIGTNGRGLYRLNSNSLIKFSLNEIFDESIVISLLEDTKGRIWAGSFGNGFVIIDDNTHEHFNGEGSLPYNQIYDFLEDESGIVWIGSGSGLMRYENGDFSIFTQSLGLINNEFFNLLLDDNGTLWSGSSNGIQFFSINELNRQSNREFNDITAGFLGLSDGLPTRQINSGISPAALRLNSGQIWMPTMRGIVLIQPDEVSMKSSAVPAIIDRLTAGETNFTPNQRIILDPGTLSFEIDYTAPEFQNPESVQFRYRLIGFDDSWTEVGNRRTAYYAGLKPGNYTFQVMAAFEGQPWHGIPATISFRISPFFYQSRWFVVLLVMGLMLIGYSTVKLRLKTIKEQELTEMVEERTKELQKEIYKHKETEKQLKVSLEEKNVLIKEMHHRVKNNLTLIYALFELQMSKVNDKALNELLSDSQFRLKSMAMLHEQLYQNELLAHIRLDNFMRELAESIHKTMGSKEISLRFDTHLAPVEIDINQSVPAGLILNELITNVYKHAFKGRSNGIITFSLNYEHPFITFTIADNGVGLPEDFDLSKASTLGLELLNTLASQLDGSIKYEYIDGSVFTVTFRKTD